jgi:hypothetical protein
MSGDTNMSADAGDDRDQAARNLQAGPIGAPQLRPATAHEQRQQRQREGKTRPDDLQHIHVLHHHLRQGVDDRVERDGRDDQQDGKHRGRGGVGCAYVGDCGPQTRMPTRN